MAQARWSAMVYLGLAVVFAGSFLITWFLPMSEVVKGAAITPGIAALFLAIWQIFRDNEAHKKQIELKEREHFFNLSVTSHMANVAFDKHVAFCEKYLEQVNKGMGKLFSEGPSRSTIDIVRKLNAIRNSYAPWVTADVVEKLQPFEDALWRIGTTSISVDSGADPNLAKRYDEMNIMFLQILKLDSKALKERPGYLERPEIGHDQILIHLQNVLGISELTRLRLAVVKNAIQSIDNT
ncbi:MAG: hypothetical protein HY203_10415 [Nitrospirae bacterium]|nr:hypothetical protein [Nitrospirota bacterium]